MQINFILKAGLTIGIITCETAKAMLTRDGKTGICKACKKMGRKPMHPIVNFAK